MSKKYKILILIICTLGIIVRLFYTIKNPIYINQYDGLIKKIETIEDYEKIYDMDEKVVQNGGHMAYIITIHNTFKLPQTVQGQYYHPPLSHIIFASFLKFMDVFPINAKLKIESMQMVGIAISIFLIYFSYRILKKLNIKNFGMLVSIMLLNFFPLFIYMSGSINNDQLVTLFIVMTIYYLLNWNEETNIKNTVKIAICFGLGMMTKTIMLVMIVPIIIVVLTKLIKNFNDVETSIKIMKQIVIFLLISLPLGFWYQIRNIIKGFGFLGILEPYEYFSTKNSTFWQRWGIVSKELLYNGIEIEHKNLFAYVLNSSLYASNVYQNFVGGALKILVMILLINVVICLIKKICKPQNENEKILNIVFISWIIAFIIFNISMPYSCSMNSRFIVVLFILGNMLIGDGIEKSSNGTIKILNIFIIFLLSILSIFLY